MGNAGGGEQKRNILWRTRLHILKNTAYAWRQMIFFLALLRDAQVQAVLYRANQHLGMQPAAFQANFHPALDGLQQVAAGATFYAGPAG